MKKNYFFICFVALILNIEAQTTDSSVRLEVNSEVSNTSGLKFTQLNSSTPVSEGTALGVDAEGNVITKEVLTASSLTDLSWTLMGKIY